jgi:hypothetical protein
MVADTKPTVGRGGFKESGSHVACRPIVNAVLKSYRNQIDLLM